MYNRQEYNRRILERLRNRIETSSDERFCQILINMGIISIDYHEDGTMTLPKDPFFEESRTTWNKLIEGELI